MWHEEEGLRACALSAVAVNLADVPSPRPRALFRNAAFAFETLMKRLTLLIEQMWLWCSR